MITEQEIQASPAKDINDLRSALAFLSTRPGQLLSTNEAGEEAVSD